MSSVATTQFRGLPPPFVSLLACDLAVGEKQHAVGHFLNAGIVRDDKDRGAELLVDLEQGLDHADAGLGVQGAGGLVAQQNIRPLRDRARDGDPLLLATRQFGGKMIHAFFEPDQRQRLIGPHRMVGNLGDQGYVLVCREAGDEIVELEHEADMVAAIARQSAVVEGGEVGIAEEEAAGGRAIEAAHDVEQRRFPAAGRP
jgi:hypothetical protein